MRCNTNQPMVNKCTVDVNTKLLIILLLLLTW